MFGLNKKDKNITAPLANDAEKAMGAPDQKAALTYIADSIKTCQKELVDNEVKSLTELKEISDTFANVMQGNEALKNDIYEFGDVFNKVSETTSRFDEVRDDIGYLINRDDLNLIELKSIPIKDIFKGNPIPNILVKSLGF